MTRRARGRRLDRGGHAAGPAPFVPPAGTALWLDATSGAAPALWTDKSGNGRNFSQGVSANQPTIVTGINGLPCVSVDAGIGQFYQGANNLTSLSAGHMFLVFKSTVAPGSFSGFWMFGSSAVGDLVPLFDNNFYTDWGSTTRRMVVPIVDARTAQILEIISTSSEWTVLQNGTQIFTTATNTVGWTTTPKIGRSASNDFAMAMYGEKLVLDHKASTPDATSVRSYLKAKWGTP